MPLWRIFAHPATFTIEQREGLSKAVTKLYTNAGLPAFYVNVLFIDLDERQVWIGGESKQNFVRIVVEQIARSFPKSSSEEAQAAKKKWMDMINKALKPFILDRSKLEWEIHIAETPRDLWRIQGIDPPPSHSEAEKEWMETNKARPWHL